MDFFQAGCFKNPLLPFNIIDLWETWCLISKFNGVSCSVIILHLCGKVSTFYSIHTKKIALYFCVLRFLLCITSKSPSKDTYNAPIILIRSEYWDNFISPTCRFYSCYILQFIFSNFIIKMSYLNNFFKFQIRRCEMLRHKYDLKINYSICILFIFAVTDFWDFG